MSQHNDSLNNHVSQAMHDAMNRTTLAIVECLRQAGLDVDRGIDFHPSTGEVIMSERTVEALRAFQAELKGRNIIIDKVMYKDDLERSGYYIVEGREITPSGFALSEGKVIGFVGLQAVDSEVSYADGKETAVGVLV